MLTERLDLRDLVSDDADALAAVFAEPLVWTFPLGRGLSYPETQAFVERQVEDRIAHGIGCWAVRLRETGELIGSGGLSVQSIGDPWERVVELGWRLDPAHWGRGYAVEIGRAAIEVAVETLGLARVVSIVQPENVRSARACERLGMRRERSAVLPPTTERRSVAVDVWALVSGGAAPSTTGS